MDIATVLAVAVASVAIAALVTFVILAIRQVLADDRMPAPARWLWVLAILCFPVLGTATWFVAGPRITDGIRSWLRGLSA